MQPANPRRFAIVAIAVVLLPLGAATPTHAATFEGLGDLLGGSFLVAVTWLPLSCVILLCVYGVSSVLYSSILKRLVIVDVLVLAGLYIVRIMAGGVAVAVPVSPWLLAFSGFLFLSLAFVKRLCGAGGDAAQQPCWCHQTRLCRPG